MPLDPMEHNIANRYAHVVNLHQWRSLARQRLPRPVFDFADGGVEDELGLQRNAASFLQYALLPRYLIDVTTRRQATTLFGQEYDSPFGIAPMGMAGLFRRGAENLLAQAARHANIPFVLSGVANITIETAAQAAPRHTWYQLYGGQDRSIALDLIRRADSVGVRTLVVTVDVPLRGKRERNQRNDLQPGARRLPSPGLLLEALRHPSWTLDYLRHGGWPAPEGYAPYAGPGATKHQVTQFFTHTDRTSQTWHDLQAYRKAWPGTLVVKGILHAQDAQQALDLGVDGIIVSNHGARQLDRAPAALDALPEIAQRVGDRLTVMLDSGIRRGSDVLIARALGARFVFLGRPLLFATAVGGLAGALRAIQILHEEIDLTLGHIGCPDLADIGPQYISDIRYAAQWENATQ